jgi:hypothetical protein
MNITTTITKRVIATTGAAAICLGGAWIAAPAQAQTEAAGGSDSAKTHILRADEIAALRAFQHAYVASLVSRAHAAARQADTCPPKPTPRISDSWLGCR